MVLQLEFTEYLQGTFAFIFVVVSITISIKILLKYLEFKKKQLIHVGIAWFGIAMPYSGDACNFILMWFDTQLPWPIYFVIGNALLPIFIYLWLAAFSNFLNIENKKRMFLLYTIYVAIFEIFFFYFLITDMLALGVPQGPFIVLWKDPVSIFLLIALVIVLITGILFARECLKQESPEIRLKGKFILIAFVSFTIAGLFDSQTATLGLPPEILAVVIVIVRLILTASAIFFYMGFILPEWVKNKLIKE